MYLINIFKLKKMGKNSGAVDCRYIFSSCLGTVELSTFRLRVIRGWRLTFNQEAIRNN